MYITTDECDCDDSFFCNPHHKHIITKDLQIITNIKLRKPLAKGPNHKNILK